MVSLRRIWPIATNTLREALRNRLLYTLLFFAVALIGFSILIASLSYVEGERIIQDLGLASIRLFSVGIAIFVGIGLIHGEVERRTIYTILAKPVRRSEFLLGKFLGLLLAVWLQLGLMSLGDVVTNRDHSLLLSERHLHRRMPSRLAVQRFHPYDRSFADRPPLEERSQGRVLVHERGGGPAQ